MTSPLPSPIGEGNKILDKFTSQSFALLRTFATPFSHGEKGWG